LSDASDLVVRYGGSLSGEHGDGQSKAEFLPKMFGDDLVQAFREFKSIFDPQGKMNPGKVVDPYLPTQNLRIGETFNPPQPVTYFKYPEDSGHEAYLEPAIASFLAGEPIARNETASFGCAIQSVYYILPKPL